MPKLWTSILNCIWEYLWEIGASCGCHQLPERSFFYKNKQFPVCSRCTGVVIGELIFVITKFFKITLRPTIYLISIQIMGFDWMIQYLNINNSTNKRRLVTGVFGGFGLLGIYTKILCYLIKKIKKL